MSERVRKEIACLDRAAREARRADRGDQRPDRAIGLERAKGAEIDRIRRVLQEQVKGRRQRGQARQGSV